MNNDELQKIDKWGEYFHFELLKYYYNFINFYKQEENALTDYLHFDFNEDGVYIINYQELQDKAYQESELLKSKHSTLGNVDDGNYKI